MKLENNWRQKSLENLEKKDEGISSPEYTSLVNRVLKLRKAPLSQFSVEDLRLMIGENQGLPYLIRLSLDILKDDLFAEGDFYPGDLLQNVLKIPVSFWKQHQELWQSVHSLIKDQVDEIADHNISVKAFYDGAS